MSGTLIGKGGKYGMFTFNEQARDKLLAYLDKRKECYPDRDFTYIFGSTKNDSTRPLGDCGLN